MGTPATFRQRVAAEIRAEMARQKRTGVQLAEVLQCSQQSVSRRLAEGQGLDLDELPLIAEWLGIDVLDLIAPGRERVSA
ncbi:MAG: hypothetical protein QM714_02855 [Nocardioides sp.]|uniref:hypothetical protein n=1 Tax=Nocardioides sp. TaxID=35761 RepID=UPI0039E431B7